jgi:uncharacterized protein involved in tolerance to divalent cations
VISRYRTLSARIGAEMEEIERTLKAAQKHWARALTAGVDQDAYAHPAFCVTKMTRGR